MRLVPYEPIHYVYLASQSGVRGILSKGTLELVAHFHFMQGIGYTALDQGAIVGCAGIVKLWPGVGEAWTVLSPAVKQRPFFLHRKVLTMLRGLIKLKEYHRVHASVNLADPIAIEWVTRLGFKQEAVLRKFSTAQEDYGVFVLFPGGE